MSNAVSTLLSSKGIYFTVSGKDYLINCLNPEHEDNNPSCRVDRVTGVTHCFSCGWKRNIFKHFGIFTNNTSVRVAKLKDKLTDLKDGNIDIEMPDGYAPFTQSFRGISVNTLRKFDAFHTNEPEKLSDRIVFPIRDATKKVVAFIGRHELSDANPRYVVHPSGRSLPLYPSILEDNYTSIVLVEGIFDMLNLYDKGLKNVVCAFGTSTLKGNDAEHKLLPFKTQGITKIFVLFDGDMAGRKAAQEIKPILEELSFGVEILDLEDDTDPGELSLKDVQIIKDYIHENSNN